MKIERSFLSIVASLIIGASSLQASNVYATVNGQEITKTDIAIALRNPKIQFDTLPKETKERIIQQLVDKKLLTSKAIKSGIQDSEQFKKDLAYYKEDSAFQIWIQQEFKKLKVSAKEKEDYYKKNELKFKKQATLEARHILVKEEKEAIDIIKTLDQAPNKKEKFIELAKTKSTGPTSVKGGYLGKFAPSQMVPEFSSAAADLKVGTYTKKPVKTQFGYHVILLESKNAAQTAPFKEVEKKIEQAVLQEKFQQHIKSIANELRKKAKIVIK